MLLNGKEDGSITSLGPSTKSINSSSGDILRLFHGEDDDFLDISKDCIISKAESLSMGHAVTVWLTEIMNYTAESIKRLDLGTAGCNTDEEQDDDDYYCLFSMNRNECLEAYGWSLKACIAISRAMMELKHQLLNQCVFDSSSSSNSNKSSGVLSLQQQQHHAQRGGSFTSSTAFSSPIGASVPPGALRSHEPTRSSTIYATESSLKVFKDLYSLLMDFDLALGWKGYHDRSTKRSCLRSASRVVFDIYAAATSRGKGKSFKGDKSNSTISHARVYKLAELLGYERVFLTGILAEEACCCGDLKAAVLLCKVMDLMLSTLFSHIGTLRLTIITLEIRKWSKRLLLVLTLVESFATSPTSSWNIWQVISEFLLHPR